VIDEIAVKRIFGGSLVPSEAAKEIKNAGSKDRWLLQTPERHGKMCRDERDESDRSSPEELHESS